MEYIGNAFQWGLTQASMVSISTTIITTSNSAVTYEFVSTGAGTIYYKLPPSAPNGTVLPTSNGPTVVVQPNSRASVAFATSSGGTYYTGYVKVSDDGFGDLVPDDGDGGDGNDSES